ncbi:NADPH-dependent diflavin oxidoreductase 1 [Entophlyctis luteolus]|nr:NADPH-dependent diflavin oxidoreductase 1 [Entophlyctis luteolus]
MRASLAILFASETGCAADCAERLARDARRRAFALAPPLARPVSVDDFFDAPTAAAQTATPIDLARTAVCDVLVFVVATAGLGVVPRNMERFWKRLLRKSRSPEPLAGMRFAVFGLGDSAYSSTFNFAGKKLYRRLLQLGAGPVVERGDGDDQHYLGLDGAFDPWCDQLWAALDALFPPPPGFSIVPKNILPPPSFNLVFLDSSTTETPLPPSDSNILTAKCIQNTRITDPNHFQDVRHVVFDVTSCGDRCKYSPADVMSIYPQNFPEDVQKVVDFLGWKEIADKPFRLASTNGKIALSSVTEDYAMIPIHIPPILTLRLALTNFLDIFGRPKRYFFELLSFFTPDIMHSEKLQEFASTAGQEELYAYCYRPRRTLFEVLNDFHSCSGGRIPPAYLFDLVPLLRPRMYSIASLDANQNDKCKTIELAVGIVAFKTRMHTMREGVSSKMIARLQPGDEVAFRMEKGTFKIPSQLAVPAIFVGAGTGIAPLRSLILERIRRGSHENYLFTGFRGKNTDNLFGKEFENFQQEGKLKLFQAFSRDDEKKVVYVQHRLLEQSQLIWECFQNGGVIFISGHAQRIPKAVRGALIDVFKKVGNLSDEESASYLSTLEKTSRFQSECWV